MTESEGVAGEAAGSGSETSAFGSESEPMTVGPGSETAAAESGSESAPDVPVPVTAPEGMAGEAADPESETAAFGSESEPMMAGRGSETSAAEPGSESAADEPAPVAASEGVAGESGGEAAEPDPAIMEEESPLPSAAEDALAGALMPAAAGIGMEILSAVSEIDEGERQSACPQIILHGSTAVYRITVTAKPLQESGEIIPGELEFDMELADDAPARFLTGDRSKLVQSGVKLIRADDRAVRGRISTFRTTIGGAPMLQAVFSAELEIDESAAEGTVIRPAGEFRTAGEDAGGRTPCEFAELTVTHHDAYVQSVSVEMTDGARENDFDADAAKDAADGKDHDGHNGIIRTFDTLTYRLSVAANTYSTLDYRSARAVVEAVLPVSRREALFDEENMPYLEIFDRTPLRVQNEAGESVEAQRIRAYYRLPTESGDTVVPGKFDFELLIRVRNMKNRAVLKPTAHIWMEHDQEGETCGIHGRAERTEVPLPEVMISAGLRLNAALVKASDDVSSVQGVFDFGTYDTGVGPDKVINTGLGKVEGRLYGFGLVLQLYNKNDKRGMKGQEIPEGPITVKLRLSSIYTPDGTAGRQYAEDDVLSGGGGADGTMKDFQPLIYSVEGLKDQGSSYMQSDGRRLATSDHNYRPSMTYPYRTVPENKGKSATSCENGGSWTILSGDQGPGKNTVTLKIEGYAMDDLHFPQTAHGQNAAVSDSYGVKGRSVEDIDIGCFSSAEIWVVQPYCEVYSDSRRRITEILPQSMGGGSFTAKVEIMEISIGGSVTADEKNKTDNVQTAVQHLLPPGGYVNRCWYSDGTAGYWNNTRGVPELHGGDEYSFPGNRKLSITGGYYYYPYGVDRNQSIGSNVLIKFDNRALEPDYSGRGNRILEPGASVKDTFYYGCLPGNGSWTDDRAMQDADVYDLQWDRTIVPGHNYAAVLVESRGLFAADKRNRRIFSIPVKVKDDAPAGEVYMTTVSTRVWSKGVAELLGKTGGRTAESGEVSWAEVIKGLPGVGDGTATRENLDSWGEIHNRRAQGSGKDQIDWGSGRYCYGQKPGFSGSAYYDKAVYHADGSMTAGGGTDTLGDSLLVISHTSGISKLVAQITGKDGAGNPVRKTQYLLDQGERYADFEITPSIHLTGGPGAENGERIYVTIRDVLPEGLTFLPQSAYWVPAGAGGGYVQAAEPGKTAGRVTGEGVRQIQVNEAIQADRLTPEPGFDQVCMKVCREPGQTVLLFQIPLDRVTEGVPGKIYYTARLGDPADPAGDLARGSLETSASIKTNRDTRAAKEELGNLAFASVRFTNNGAGGFRAAVRKSWNEVNDSLTWILTWTNNSKSVPETVRILNTMPKTGDISGSRYDGSYKITDFRMEVTGGAAPADSFEVRYAVNDPKYDNRTLAGDKDTEPAANKITWEEALRGMRPYDASAGFPGELEERAEAGRMVKRYDPEDFVSAWAVSGILKGGETLRITFTVHQDSPKAGDILTDTGSTPEFARRAAAYRIQREISGYVWLDENLNGCMDAGEHLFDGVKVELRRQGENSPAEDLHGKPCRTVTGAAPQGGGADREKGRFSFTDLPAGVYRLVFMSGDDAGKGTIDDLGRYDVAPAYAVDVGDTQNCKAYGSGLAGIAAVIDNILMRDAANLTLALDKQDYQNAGFFRKARIGVTKRWDESAMKSVETRMNAIRPGSVTLGLYKKSSDEAVREITLTGERTDDIWTGEIGDLPVYERGAEIDYANDYEIREIRVPHGYSCADAAGAIHLSGSSGSLDEYRSDPVVNELIKYEAAGTAVIDGRKEIVQADWDRLDDTKFEFMLYELMDGREVPAVSRERTFENDRKYRVEKNPVSTGMNPFRPHNFYFGLRFSLEDLRTEKEDGSVAFEPKDFTFVIREVPREGFLNEGGTYYELTYTVSDRGDGSLNIEPAEMFCCVNGRKSGSLIRDGIPECADFTNLYLAQGEAELTLSKTLSGNRAADIAAGEFTFTASELANDPGAAAADTFVPRYREGREPYVLKSGAGSGDSRDGTHRAEASVRIFYDQSMLMEGTDRNDGKPGYGRVLWYELKEDPAGKASVTVSDAVCYARVELHNDYQDQALVKSRAEGLPAHRMTSEVSYWRYGEDGILEKIAEDEGAVFENHYRAAGELVIGNITKILENGSLEAGQFTFELKAEDGTVFDTASNDAEGNVAFQALKYTQEDIGRTYHYTVTEAAGREAGIVYDTSVYDITVRVEDGRDSDGALAVTQKTFCRGRERKTAVFTNRVRDPVTQHESSREDSMLVVAKQLMSGGLPVQAVGQTFHVALFGDAALTQRISDVKDLVFSGSDTAAAVFTGLEPGSVCYVSETDARGSAVLYGEIDAQGNAVQAENTESALFRAVYPDGNAVTAEKGMDTKTLVFHNEFLEIPERFYIEGELSITKRLIGADGQPRSSDTTFYAGIFADAAHTVLSDHVSQNIVALNLAGGSSANETVKVSFAAGERQTLYVTETDAEGRPLENSADFGYLVTIEGAAAELWEEQPSASVTVINQESPGETESDPDQNSKGTETESEQDPREAETGPDKDSDETGPGSGRDSEESESGSGQDSEDVGSGSGLGSEKTGSGPGQGPGSGETEPGAEIIGSESGGEKRDAAAVPPETVSAKTGDGTPVGRYLALLLGAVLVLGALLLLHFRPCRERRRK